MKRKERERMKRMVEDEIRERELKKIIREVLQNGKEKRMDSEGNQAPWIP